MSRNTLITFIARLLSFVFPTTRPPERVSFDAILILKPCCLGDVLLATPVIAAVRRAYPNAQIDFAVGSWSHAAVANHPQLRRIVDTGQVGQGRYSWRDVWTLARRLRANRYDLCLTLDRSPRVGLVAWLARIPMRAGLDSGGRGFAHNVRVPVPPIRYEPELYLDVPRAVIPQTAKSKFEFTPSQFFPTDGDQSVVSKILSEWQVTGDKWHDSSLVTRHSSLVTFVAIHPGGGNNPGTLLPSKRWPAERFAQIADRLIDEYHATVILVGGESDAEITQAVRGAMESSTSPPAPLLQGEGSARLIDLSGQLTIGQLGALYRRCTLMIGNDSGVMHLANAVGTPTVALYGPSDPRVYGPYNAKSLALWHEVGCNPCFVNGRARADCCPHHAIEAIAVEECWEAVQVVLRRQGIRGYG
ncbi:MAG: glycosyltransferase family 9 protein [Chloroflexota bacterium]